MALKPQKNLPQNYREAFRIDLLKDKKLLLLVNGLGLAIFAVFFVLGLVLFPLQIQVSLQLLLKMVVCAVGMLLYIVLHELTHGFFIKYFTGESASYGFNGMYAFAGSKAYFDKKSYIIIALAPIIIWGIVLCMINLVIPVSWFWVVYFIQLTNLSGAAGDIYVTVKLKKIPENVLIFDSGTAMTIYVPQEK